MSKDKKKCTCGKNGGKNNGMTCSNCSRYRIAIYITKKHLPLFPEIQPTDRFQGKAFYSRVAFNNHSSNSVLERTKKNLSKTENPEFKMALKYAYQILFYDNITQGGKGIDITDSL